MDKNLAHRVVLYKPTASSGKIKGNLLVKVAGCYRNQKTACRDLTRLIKRTPGTMLNLPIDVCRVQVKLRKPIRCLELWWPMIKMSEWCQYFIAKRPQLLLGGRTLDEDWMGPIRSFWDDYRVFCPDHPVFSTAFDLGTCIPYYVHGDEGRGHLKRPYMVLSWQCVIGHLGPGVCNDSSWLGGICSRFFSVHMI